MRENLFRGKGDKRYNDGVWYYGVPIRDYEGDWQICTRNSKRTVIPETVGQYIELPDKNGKKIFDGDIVRVLLSWDGDDVMDVGRVFYSEELCGFYRTSKVFGGGCPSMTYTDEYEVIGNIFDDPELIGEKTND